MMSRLSKGYPFAKTMSSRLHRHANKLIGRLATLEVGTMSDMITKIREMTMDVVSMDPKIILLVTPKLLGLANEDVNDAMEYAGVESMADKAQDANEFKKKAALHATG